MISCKIFRRPAFLSLLGTTKWRLIIWSIMLKQRIGERQLSVFILRGLLFNRQLDKKSGSDCSKTAFEFSEDWSCIHRLSPQRDRDVGPRSTLAQLRNRADLGRP